MILSIKIKDDTYRKYAEMDSKVPQRAIERMLEKHSGSDPKKRFVMLEGAALDKVEVAMGTTLSKDNVEDLGELVKQLVAVRVDAKDVPLSKGQRYRLEREAEFYKRTFDDLLVERLVALLADKWGQ